jgi:CheY-like chemotaxis protein
MESDQAFSSNTMPFRILLADDDEDDHFFFEDVLAKFKFKKEIEIVEDGERLLAHLKGKGKLPDVLFLDYNIPRRNGEECLIEIKKDPVLKALPVIIYSTYLHEEVADTLYNQGAHFFVRKTNSKSLEKILHKVFTLLMVEKSARPERAAFIITA